MSCAHSEDSNQSAHLHSQIRVIVFPCADPEVGTGVQTPLKNHKHIGFLIITNTGADQSYQASIQCWANVGLPAKRYLAFHWRADDGPL